MSCSIYPLKSTDIYTLKSTNIFHYVFINNIPFLDIVLAKTLKYSFSCLPGECYQILWEVCSSPPSPPFLFLFLLLVRVRSVSAIPAYFEVEYGLLDHILGSPPMRIPNADNCTLTSYASLDLSLQASQPKAHCWTPKEFSTMHQIEYQKEHGKIHKIKSNKFYLMI